MMLALLPSLVALMATPGPAALAAPPAAVEPSPAQARLAEALADADSVDTVRADPARAQVTFEIQRAGERYEILVSSGPDGAITRVTSKDVGRGARRLGRLSWLVDAMAREAAVVRLELGADGAVTLVTPEGERLAVRARPADASGAAPRWPEHL